MCSLIVFLFLVECCASKNSLLFYWGHMSIIVLLSRSKSCPICSMCLAKMEFRSRVAMALQCSCFLVFKARNVCLSALQLIQSILYTTPLSLSLLCGSFGFLKNDATVRTGLSKTLMLCLPNNLNILSERPSLYGSTTKLHFVFLSPGGLLLWCMFGLQLLMNDVG